MTQDRWVTAPAGRGESPAEVRGLHCAHAEGAVLGRVTHGGTVLPQGAGDPPQRQVWASLRPVWAPLTD